MMAEQIRELDNLSRTIGSLEQGQRETKTSIERLEVKIENMVGRFETVIVEIRRRYHELNNEAMKNITRVEVEFERRIVDLERAQSVAMGERRVLGLFWTFGGALGGGIVVVLGEWLLRHLP